MSSDINGNTLARVLTLLNCNEGRTLEGETFDWLFEDPKLRQFLESFCKAAEYGKIASVTDDTINKEINPEFIAKELKKYNLSNVSEIDNEIQRKIAEIEMKEKAKREIINQRKILSSCLKNHKVEVSDVESLKEQVENEFKVAQEKCLGTFKELSDVLDNLVIALTEFTNESDSRVSENSSLERQNLSCSSFCNSESYMKLEETFLSSLKGYVNEKFKMPIWAEENDTEFNDSSDQGLENFLRWKKELCRLHESLINAKQNLIRAEAIKEGLKEQIAILEEKISKNIPEQGLDVWQLKLKIDQATIKNNELTKELTSFSEDILPKEVLKYVNLLMNEVVTANYDIKEKRQQYFIDKQANLIRLLVQQQSRLAFLHIAEQIDSRQNSKLQEVLRKIAKEFRDEAELSQLSYEYMKNLKIETNVENPHLPPSADIATNVLADVIGHNEDKLYVSYESMRNFAEDFRKKYEELKKTMEENSHEQDQLMSQISFDFNLLDKTLTPLVLDKVESFELKQTLSVLETEFEKLELKLRDIKSSYSEKVKFLENSEREKSKREEQIQKFT